MNKSLTLLAFIFCASGAYGAILPKATQEEIIDDFSGGLNTSNPSHKISSNYSPYMRNVYIDNGKIERANGFVTIGSSRTLTKVTGIYPFVRESGQTTFLVTDSSITLETADFLFWTFVSSGSNTGSILRWLQVRNKMWGFNGVDSVITYDGTTKVILNGSGSTPNVPKFKYGAYYQDRVWGFSVPNAASDLYFTSTISTDNVIIAPDDNRAFPPINLLHVGQGDGTIGTSLFVHQGFLRAGKERSIHTIYGDDPSNYFPKKEETKIGIASDESVVVLDGQSYYLGPDGIYRDVTRISDLIEPDVGTFNSGTTNIVENSWDTQTDFARGQFFGTTATVTGLLINQAGHFKPNTAETNPGAQFIQLNSTGMATIVSTIVAGSQLPQGFFGYPARVRFWVRYNETGTIDCHAGAASNPLTFTIRNARTGSNGSVDINGGLGSAFNGIDLDFGSGPPVNFDAQDINTQQSSFTMTVKVNATDSKCVFDIMPASQTNVSTVDMFPSSTTQFISDISTLSSNVAWANFDSVRTTNGGTINYFFRTSTSPVNVATQTWQGITPGVVIPAPTINKYIQWASTLTALQLAMDIISIDKVTIDHIEGQSSASRAVGIDWKNRYWLSVTTGTDTSVRAIYVKSKFTNRNPNAWMVMDGIPINCFARTSTVLYGGAISTGIIYRLDYGTNYDGAPIQSIYDTPDLALKDYFFNKYIHKYLIDGSKSAGGVMSIGSSVNQGDFTYSTFSITGTGRYSRIVEGVTSGVVKTLRLRLQNGQKDIGLGINNVDILYDPTGVLSNK